MVKRINAGQDLHTEFSYDADRNVSTRKTVLGGVVLADNTYAYDRNGNRVEKRGLDGCTAYRYDGRNQLVKAEYPAYTEELFYDRAGNRTKRLSQGMEEIYEYDERNRLRKQSFVNPLDQTVTRVNEFAYDEQGNMLHDGRNSYQYDAFNRAECFMMAGTRISMMHSTGQWKRRRRMVRFR